MKSCARTTFKMVQNFLFLEDSVVDHFFIDYLQQFTFLPKEKKSNSEKKFIMFCQEHK